MVPGDTLWGIARRYLGSGSLWPSIYNDNQPVLEKVAQKYGHSSSRRGGLIFPGTGVKVSQRKKTGLLNRLTPEHQQFVACLANVTEVYAELRGKAAGKALLKAGLPELSKLLKNPTVIDALTKPVGALKSCGPLARNAGGLVGLAREALRESPELDRALGNTIFNVNGLACLDSIVGGASVNEVGINLATGKAAKDILETCPDLLLKAGAVHSALEELGIPAAAE